MIQAITRELQLLLCSLCPFENPHPRGHSRALAHAPGEHSYLNFPLDKGL